MKVRMPFTRKSTCCSSYTNDGKVYSESDYGSEYGIDNGGVGGGGYDDQGQQHHNGRHRGGSPSEAGTYHSRYDGGGSTMNRLVHHIRPSLLIVRSIA